jgi:rare lipoprotein A
MPRPFLLVALLGGLLASCMPAASPVAQHLARPAAALPSTAAQGQASDGLASWYGPGFAGRRTANGEVFDPSQLTAAHKTLPFGTQVKVTNLNNGSSVVVRINDRGPFKPGRVIDLSRAAAERIGMVGSGIAPVRLELLTARAATNALHAALDRSLTGYSVVTRHFQVGEILLLASADASDPMLARVVSNDLREDAGVDLLISPALFEQLGEQVTVLNP